MRIKPFKKPKAQPADGGKKPQSGGTERVNRTVYLTVATLLIVLAVAVAMTSAANRAKRGANTEPETTTANSPSSTEAPETRTPATLAPGTEPATPGTEAQAPGNQQGGEVEAAKKVPVLSLPADGALGKSHDPTIQVFSNTMNEWRVHLGVDIMTAEGAPVYAAADGIVTAIGDDPLMGHYITIGHTGESETVYRNLSLTVADGIAVGSSVKAGQLIGAVGDGAVLELADEPHLHFEMKINGEEVDPLLYLSTDALAKLQAAADTSFEG